MSWLDHVQADPRPWLLDPSVLGVRAATLQVLEDRSAGDRALRSARRAAMAADPIKATAGWRLRAACE